MIGGAQGSGVDSAANIFSRACCQGGLKVFGNREYYSNIKGEHSYFTVRVSDDQNRSHLDDINVLVSFDAETVFRHAFNIAREGVIIYDPNLSNTILDEVATIDEPAAKRIVKTLKNDNSKVSLGQVLNLAEENGAVLYDIPYYDLLRKFSTEINEPALSKLTRMINVMAVSASLAVLDFDRAILAKSIKLVFRAKPKIADMNVLASNFAYDYVRSRFGQSHNFKLTCKPPIDQTILVQGNQSSAMGKLVAGCKFQTYYPITPASDDSEFLESNQEVDQTNGEKGSIVVVQTEDEIAAIAMAIGGSLTGVRTATATSGPGFSLMTEALGWSGMNEVPLVVSLYQRTGPATGLPTRTEQADLMFAIHAGHGEFPRIVFASGDIEESFYDSIKAFNFAEKYQMPVIHMLDKAIANSVMTCKYFDQSRITIDRGKLVQNPPKLGEAGTAGNYLRFKLADGPVSDRITLGTENAIFWNTGDEHTEEGHITEDPGIRISMMEKRLSKLDLALQEILDEDKAVEYGHNTDSLGLTLISWGSTKGAILDAMDQLSFDGRNLHFVQVRLMNPFPTKLLEKLLNNTKVLVDIEMNYSSQLASLIERHLHRHIDYKIVKFNGRPMSASEVYNALTRIINGNASKRMVLKHGT
jgi:2-oxoglutarate ferredoxin oxidoreductase subunit alpha